MQRAEHDQWKSSEVARLLALVESERRYYQDVISVLPVAIALVDHEWRLVAVNREFRLRVGGLHTDLSRMRMPDLIPDPALEAAMEEVLSTGQGKPDFRVELEGESGRRSLRVTIQKILGWQAVSEDELLLTFTPEGGAEQAGTGTRAVETQAEANAAQRRAERAKLEQAKRGAMERLSGRLAHVANNLLMIIGGYADEIVSSMEEGDPRREDVGEIVKAANRLGALTKDLTTLTRPPSFDASDFGMARWLRAMRERLGEYRVSCGEAEAGLRARTSPVLLEQMVVEAARYLRPHLGEGGRLRLAAGGIGEDRIEIRLRVEGQELSEEALERFFEPFAGEKVGTDPPLGLAGLLRPWEVLGGTAELEADCLVLGCPQAQSQAEPEELATVLLVEDEPGIRSLIAKALERNHYKVLQAGAPADALALGAGLAGVDVLVTDLMMTGMSGRELAEKIRGSAPGTKVLFISGYTSDAELAAQIGRGGLPAGTLFLAKPFTVAQLVEKVKQLLGPGQ